MRKIELEAATKFGMQLRLAERVPDEANLARLDAEVTSQQVTQGPVRDNKAPPVALEAKPLAAISLVIRERRIIRLGSDVQTDAPTLHEVDHFPPPSRTPP